MKTLRGYADDDEARHDCAPSTSYISFESLDECGDSDGSHVLLDNEHSMIASLNVQACEFICVFFIILGTFCGILYLQAY